MLNNKNLLSDQKNKELIKITFVEVNFPIQSAHIATTL